MNCKYIFPVLFIIAILLALSGTVQGQGTLVSNARCEAYAGGVCEGIIKLGAPVYVQGDTSQGELTKEILSREFLFRIASPLSGCNRVMLAALCANAFPSCGYNDNNQIVPIYPCPQVCSDIITYCPLLAPFLTSYTSPISMDDPAMIGIFPQCAPKNERCESRYEYEFVNANLAEENVVTPTPMCPGPLVNAIEGYESILDGLCAIPCPNLSYTPGEYEQEDIVIIFFNVLSLVLMLFLFISWSLFPALRLKSYVYYYFFCILMVTASLFFLIPIAGSDTIASSLCRNSVQEYHMTGYSLFQGIVVTFFYIAGIAWSLVLSFDIFFSVVLGKHYTRNSDEARYKEIIYHVFSWGMALYAIIGGLASEQIGATLGVGGAYSLITPSRTQIKEGKFDAGDPFFYFPLLIMTCISALLMILTLIKLAKFKFDTNTLSGLKKATFVRLFLFIIANTFIICVFIIYKLYVVDQRDSTEQAALDFAYCKLFIHDIFGTDCGERPSSAPNFSVLLLTVALMNGMGVIAFLIYGTTANLYLSYLGYLHVRWKFSMFKGYSEYYHSSQNSSVHHSSRTSRTGSNTATQTQTTGGSHPAHSSQAADDTTHQLNANYSSAERGGARTVFDYANRKNRYTMLEMTSMNRPSQGGIAASSFRSTTEQGTPGPLTGGGSSSYQSNSPRHQPQAPGLETPGNLPPPPPPVPASKQGDIEMVPTHVHHLANPSDDGEEYVSNISEHDDDLDHDNHDDMDEYDN